MQIITIIVLAATAASASILKRQNTTGDPADDAFAQRLDYLLGVCNPQHDNDDAAIVAPCNSIWAIEAQCTYGPTYLAEHPEPYYSSAETSEDVVPFDSETQRICMCQSQLFDQMKGCNACYKAHGGQEGVDLFSDSIWASLSSSYCAATTTPTLGGSEYILSYLNPTAGFPDLPEATSSFSDPIGNRTDVSLYYTPSITGTAAFVVALPTVSGNASSFSYSSVNTQNGQIVPTPLAGQAASSRSAALSEGASGSTSVPSTDSASGSVTPAPTGSASGSAAAISGTASGSSSSSAGAMETAIVRKEALAGVLGLAGLLAFL